MFAIRPWIIGLIALGTIAFLGKALGQSESEAMEQEKVRHFIVAIDVSGDMKALIRTRDIVVLSIPRLLFHDFDTKKVGPLFEMFRPGIDKLSIVYFALTKAKVDSKCKSFTGYDARPEYLFTWQKLSDPSPNKTHLTDKLRGLLKEPCVPVGAPSLSPIVTAESTVAAFVGKQLAKNGEQDLLFDQTYLIVASNDAYNGSPSRELPFYQKRFGVKNIEAALAHSARIRKYFYIESPENWVFTINTKTGNFLRGVVRKEDFPLILRVSELRPVEGKNATTAFIDFRKTNNLDRLAVSDTELRLLDEAGVDVPAEIRFVPSDRFKPISMTFEYEGSAEEPLRIGKREIPERVTVDLGDCQLPTCQRDEKGNLSVSPLAAAGVPAEIKAKDLNLTAGKIRFRTVFRYGSGGPYYHLRIKTDWKEMDIKLVPFLELRGSRWLGEDARHLTNFDLVEQWREEDGRLSQHKARQRLLDKLQRQETDKIKEMEEIRARERAREEWEQTVFWLELLAASIAILISTYLLLHWLFYNRPFRPQLIWQSAEVPKLDFNRSSASHVLLGTLTVQNTGLVPWFGRLLGNKTQPRRNAKLHLEYEPEDDNIQLDEKPVTALGFLTSKQQKQQLISKVDQDIADNDRFYVFFASDAVTDCECPDEVFDPTQKTFSLKARLDWQSQWGDRVAEDLLFTQSLRLLREHASPPRICFKHLAKSVYYVHRKKVSVGTFVLESTAQHSFAQPFKGRFAILARDVNGPLEEGVIAFDRDRLNGENEEFVLQGRETLEVPVVIDCNGESVKNPYPSKEEYSIRIIGDYAPGSYPEPSDPIVLRRDPVKAGAQLVLEHRRKQREIYWPKESNTPRVRLRAQNGELGMDEPLAQGCLRFSDVTPLRFEDFDVRGPLFFMELGNTGRSGNGMVQLDWSTKLIVQDKDKELLPLLHDNASYDSLIVLVDAISNQSYKNIEVREKEPSCKAIFGVDYSRIKSFEGGRSPELTAQLILDISVRDELDEEGAQTRYCVQVEVPFTLEKLPSPLWLAIDFGTSSISAAQGKADRVKIIDLQQVEDSSDRALQIARNFRDFDTLNPEIDTDFLPSYVLCDADQRQEPSHKSYVLAGFSGFQPASLCPGAPSFISLPPSTTQLQRHADRVIFSLKSWLGQAAFYINLPTRVRYRNEDDEEVQDSSLELEPLMESAFAALATAYLAKPIYRGGQLVVTHPNTFTEVHCERLKRCVFQAVSKPLDIPLEDRIALISESDAVAYYYCQQRRNEGPVKGTERILVYDFGAGTLDLTLVRLKWHERTASRPPEEWVVENRLGVPVAGNHLDSILARLIDELLSDDAVLDKQSFEYRYPVVAMDFNHNPPDRTKEFHLDAIYEFARAIKQAKQGDAREGIDSWDGRSPFIVQVGSSVGGNYLVGITGPAAFQQLPSEPIDSAPTLCRRGEKELCLAIPADDVRNFAPMREFMDFVTLEVIEELLLGAGLGMNVADTVNTLLVSGRGALWPGLREAVWDRFPDSVSKPDLHEKFGDRMKDAVVRGAIAWQQLKGDIATKKERQSQLAILLEGSGELIPDSEWRRDKPIDLSSSASFRLVQCETIRPDPAVDMQGLRRYFYIDVDKKVFNRATRWYKDPPHLYAKKDHDPRGHMLVRLENADGECDLVGISAQATRVFARPPWPVGIVLLSPYSTLPE